MTHAMLMSPNKGETAVYGCHCQGDMVLRMLKVIGIPRSWYVCFCAVIMLLVSLRIRTVAVSYTHLTLPTNREV